MRLIDADALLDALKVDHIGCMGCPEPEFLDELIDILDTAPTVEPERVGEWEERIIEDDSVWTRHRYYCSACGGWTTYGKTDFCPRCGAKMKNGGDY